MTTMVLTAAEIQAMRETLGLTGDWLADHLGVSPRTIRHWEHGKYAVPEGVDKAMRALEGRADREFRELAADMDYAIGNGYSAVLHVYRTTAEYEAAGLGMTAAWHRAVAYRVRQYLPTVRVDYTSSEGVSHTDTYTGDIADLALPHDVEDRLRDALGGDSADEIQDELRDRINAKLRRYGVTSEGEWLGVWDATAIVTKVLDRHS
jgi:transcriptional regulator with XRE-family HTH domain